MIQIVVDVRESGILQKLDFAKVEFSKKQLPLGDILLIKKDNNPIHQNIVENNDDNENNQNNQNNDEILVYIERKTLQDLLSSIKDGRYDEQSFRLANAIQGEVPRHRVIYIIEGFFSTLSLQEKNLVLSAMTSIQLFKGFSVWRTSSLQETVDVIIAMAGKIERDLKKGKTMYQEVAIPTIVSDNADQDQNENPNNTNPNTNTNQNTNNPNPQYSSVVKKVKKNNLTPQNMAEIMLSQIPDISTKTATVIMKKMGTFSNLLRELEKDPACLENILLETGRKINKKCSAKIIEFLQL